MTTKILKPCPLCGNTEIYNVCERVGEAWIYCGCGLRLTGSPEELVYQLWNTRPIEDALRAELARVTEANRWIPVGERLPEAFKKILITTDEGSGEGVYNPRQFPYYFWNIFDPAYRITHWRPLPAPPE